MSASDGATVNPKDTIKLSTNGLNTFSVKVKPVFINGPSSLPKNPLHCTIFDNLVFKNFILGYKPFVKALEIFETCLLVNNKLCGKLVSSSKSPITFDENFIVT